jgi:hypothetical protein
MHDADNTDWAILGILTGEGPRTFEQLAWHLNLLSKLDLMLGLRRLLNEGKIVRDGDLLAVPVRSTARNNPVNILAEINALIRTRTSYGYTLWRTAKKGTLLRWSNSQAAWTVWGTQARGKQVFSAKDPDFLRLDADMILVPYSKKDVEPLLPKLTPLPLYDNSTEGKRRSVSNPRAWTRNNPDRPSGWDRQVSLYAEMTGKASGFPDAYTFGYHYGRHLSQHFLLGVHESIAPGMVMFGLSRENIYQDWTGKDHLALVGYGLSRLRDVRDKQYAEEVIAYFLADVNKVIGDRGRVDASTIHDLLWQMSRR